MTSELKPCPFCGGKAVSGLHIGDDHERYGFVSCKKCPVKTQGKILHWGDNTDAELASHFEAELAWNTRAVPDVAELKVVSHEVFYAPTREWRKTVDPDYYRKNDSLIRDLVDKDQAAAVIAAKDAEINKLNVYNGSYHNQIIELRELLQATEAKLAQSEKQKPVAWLLNKAGGSPFTTTHETEAKAWKHGVTPLYTAPVASDADLRAAAIMAEEYISKYSFDYDGRSPHPQIVIEKLRSALNPSEPMT